MGHVPGDMVITSRVPGEFYRLTVVGSWPAAANTSITWPTWHTAISIKTRLGGT